MLDIDNWKSNNCDYIHTDMYTINHFHLLQFRSLISQYCDNGYITDKWFCEYQVILQPAWQGKFSGTVMKLSDQTTVSITNGTFNVTFGTDAMSKDHKMIILKILQNNSRMRKHLVFLMYLLFSLIRRN